MTAKLLDIIVGTRPNFVKAAPLLRRLSQPDVSAHVTPRLIHTGQHYDAAMNATFFTQLGLPDPDIHFHAGRSGATVAEQTGIILRRYEAVLADAKCDACLVFGDVTSSLAAALSAKRARVPVIHYEAGVRSGETFMQEEINRLAIDAISDWFLTTSRFAVETLRASGVQKDKIFQVGNLMADCLIDHEDQLTLPTDVGLPASDFALATVHRPENVDDPTRLQSLVHAVASVGLPIIFPAHPRTAQRLQGLEIPAEIKLIEAQPYLSFVGLMKASRLLVTDSGGAAEEATVLGTPCVTLRDAYEAKETLTHGTNHLAGTDPQTIRAVCQTALAKGRQPRRPDGWDGNSAQRIVDLLPRLLGS
ncbi:MAG: UDP-N-acetylglucosamine 2-epimerase (non-hydrolyzing) [Pseudomonadota bacterium]